MKYTTPSLSCALLISSLALSGQLLAQNVEWEVTEGSVGVGTGSPAAKLHVAGEGAQLLVEDTNEAKASRYVYEIRNLGSTKFNIVNTDPGLPDYKARQGGVAWAFANYGYGLRFTRQDSGVVEFELNNNGNLKLAGNLTVGGIVHQSSDVNLKQDIEAIDAGSLLQKVMDLPITEWSYKSAPGSRHIGPMAQDFYQTFALGDTDKSIATIDTAGVALAAIQAVKREKDREIELLKANVERQAEQIIQLEIAIAEMLRRDSPEAQVSLYE